MIIKENINNLLPISDLDNYYVVTDFDRTITDITSKTTWAMLANDNLVPTGYVKERQALYDKYRPIEIDETIDFDKRSALVKEWYEKHIDLFVKYKITEELFEESTNDLEAMKFREGAKEFLQFLADNNVPVIINSAGLTKYIECFLKKNNCLFNNIYINSNNIVFKNGFATGVDNIIHSFNKGEVSFPKEIKQKLSSRKNVLLLGDQIGDLLMVDKKLHDEVITIGFFSTQNNIPLEEYTKSFDIVCEDEESYKILITKIFKDNKKC